MSDVFLDSHNEEIVQLATRFRSYGTGIDRGDVRQWLSQFEDAHKRIGLKYLRLIDFYDPPRITTNYQIAHQQFLATCSLSSIDNVTFFPFGRAGKSASSMSYLYATANNIHENKFKYFSELSVFQGSGEPPIIAFIDDFIGTGSQACDTYDMIREIPLPRDSIRALIVLVGFDEGIRKIRERTDLVVICPRILTEEDRIFSDENEYLENTEKEILKTYCERVGQWPEGFGNCQSSVVFHYKSSDNIPSILRCYRGHWNPLFPRRIRV